MTSTRQNLIALMEALAQDCDITDSSILHHVRCRVETRGIQDLALELQTLKVEFLNAIETSSAEFGRGILGNFFRKIARKINDDPGRPENRVLFKNHYQYLSFLSKARDFDVNVNTRLSDFQNYCTADQSLPLDVQEFYQRFYKTHDRDVLGLIRANLFALLNDSSPTNNGLFGPGSVNDSTFSDKFVAPLWCTDDVVRYSGIYSEDHFLASLDRFPSRTNFDYFGIHKNRSEFLLVPKDVRGPRTICRESTGNSIHQQSLRLAHQSAIHLNSGGFVNFDDQSVNKLLALSSSRSRNYSTIDLKDASDRISKACVEAVFPHDFLTTALMSRSSEVFFQDHNRTIHTHTLRKWAPMGSAICFTTLSALVYATCRAVAPDSHIFVYGDDLIIPSEVTEICVSALEAVGLLVNRHKSFSHSLFRESCGMDAYDGMDCTPIKLRFLPSLVSFQDVSLASLCSTAHQLYHGGLLQTAIALQTQILEFAPKGVDVPQGRVTDPFLTVPLSYAPNRKEAWRVDPSLQLRYKRLRLVYLVDKTTKTRENDTLYFYRAVSKSLVFSEDVLDSRFDSRVSKRDVVLKYRTSRVVLDGATGVRVI